MISLEPKKIGIITVALFAQLVFFSATIVPLIFFAPSSALTTSKVSQPLVAPTDVSIVPKVGGLEISWNPGQDSQDNGVKYTVASNPSGLSCSIKDGTSCSLSDTVSTPYSFYVIASKTGLADSPASSSTSTLNPHLVLVLAGQSNATGYQSYATDPLTGIDYLAPPYTNGADSNDLISWLPWGGVQEGSGANPVPLDTPQESSAIPSETIFGPEIGLARQLFSDNNRPLTIVKDAYGGSDLAVNWAPGGSGAAPYGLYPAMVDSITSTMSNDAAKGQFDVLGGFYWYQGESDSFVPSYAKQYKGNLVKFIKDLRKDLPMAVNAPIILTKEDSSAYDNYSESIGTITASQDAAQLEGNTEVRAADDYAASNLPNVFEVDSSGLSRVSPYIHLSNTSELTIGEDMASVSLNHIP